MRPRTGCQPEIQGCIHQVDHFLIIEVTATIIHTSLACLKCRLRGMYFPIILTSEFENLFL